MNIGVCGNVDIIKKGIEKCEDIELGYYGLVSYTPENLILDIEEEFFDCALLFLDIGIGEFKDDSGGDYPYGIELAHKVNNRFPQCQIIYITDKQEFDERVYDTKHTYLMPRDKVVERMPKAISLFLDNRKSIIDKDVIQIISGGRREYIRRNQIVYIERDGRKIFVVAQGKKYPCCSSITKLMAMMDSRMVRVNGGAIVNLDYVTYYGKGRIEVSSDNVKTSIIVGRNYQKSVREAYFEYWGNHSS